jgi:ERCC4-related helicase
VQFKATLAYLYITQVAISLSRVLGLLFSHGIQSFYNSLDAYVEEARSTTAKLSSARQKLIKDPSLIKLMTFIPERMRTPGFMSHPKVERLVGLVINHFVSHQSKMDNARAAGEPKTETRVMIFSQFRDSVDEIVSHLNQHNPMIKVCSSYKGHVFCGPVNQ